MYDYRSVYGKIHGGVRELKARLSEYLKGVSLGDVIEVTSRGETVARILPNIRKSQDDPMDLVKEGIANWNGKRVPARLPKLGSMTGLWRRILFQRIEIERLLGYERLNQKIPRRTRKRRCGRSLKATSGFRYRGDYKSRGCRRFLQSPVQAKITEDQLKQAMREFRQHWPAYLRIRITEPMVRDADHLAIEYNLRGYDAIHLAGALVWKDRTAEAVLFATFDDNLWKAASTEGFQPFPEKLPSLTLKNT